MSFTTGSQDGREVYAALQSWQSLAHAPTVAGVNWTQQGTLYLLVPEWDGLIAVLPIGDEAYYQGVDFGLLTSGSAQLSRGDYEGEPAILIRMPVSDQGRGVLARTG